jgi:PAS domain S-box-containing protein
MMPMMASSVTTGWESAAELAQAGLVLALISACVMAGVFGNAGRRLQRAAYERWALGWLFYAVFLAAQIAAGFLADDSLLEAVPSTCVAISAWLLYCGNSAWQERSPARRRIAVGAGLVVIVFLAAQVENLTHWLTWPAFAALAGTAAHAGWLRWRDEQPRASRMLWTGGWLAWAVATAAFPVAERFVAWLPLVAIGSAACAVAIVLGVLIEQQVEFLEQKYRSVLDGTSDAVFIVDLWRLKVIDANQAAARLTRRDPADLVGCSFLDLCPDLHQEGSNQLDQRQMFAAVFKPFNEFHLARGDGTMVICEGDTSLARWHERPVVQVRAREVAPEKNIGRLVRRAEKMSSLGQLIAGVAHELNNPLAVVLAYAQLLIKHPIADEVVRDNVQRILHETERAAKIVRDLLLFARPCEPQLTVVDLNQTVVNVCDVRQRDFESYRTELRQNLQPGLPRTKADPIQLEQVLNNLITNAFHAMAGQPGKRVLTVSTGADNHFIRISVRDTGCGIPPEVMAKMFDPFFTTKPVGKGTGLGLSISRSILEEHRGRLWAESEPGQGATFHLDLPIVPCEDPAPVVERPTEASAAGAATEGFRLLVVDDEPGIRDVLEMVLVERGYQVTCVTNGLEAIDRLKREHFDLIISDMCMPEMDGERLYETVREKNPKLADRILFVTGDVVSARSRAFLERTGSRWLSKPFNIRDVEEVVAGSLCHAAVGPAAGRGPMLN